MKLYVDSLSVVFPDMYWKNNESKVLYANREHPLENVAVDVRDHGAIMGMTFTDDGTMLATFSSVGLIKVWDADTWELICSIRDKDEKQIDEFYCGTFINGNKYLAVGGKLKDRNRWFLPDEDNHILPTNIKVGRSPGLVFVLASAFFIPFLSFFVIRSLICSLERWLASWWDTVRRSCHSKRSSSRASFTS